MFACGTGDSYFAPNWGLLPARGGAKCRSVAFVFFSDWGHFNLPPTKWTDLQINQMLLLFAIAWETGQICVWAVTGWQKNIFSCSSDPINKSPEMTIRWIHLKMCCVSIESIYLQSIAGKGDKQNTKWRHSWVPQHRYRLKQTREVWVKSSGWKTNLNHNPIEDGSCVQTRSLRLTKKNCVK